MLTSRNKRSLSVKVLADTGVWIAFFRPQKDEVQRRLADVLDQLILEDRVVLCGVVELELLQGVRAEERPGLEAALSALEFISTTRADFQRAGELLGTLRRRGMTIPTTDGLIAAQCLQRDLTLLENDKHFAEIELRHHAWREEM